MYYPTIEQLTEQSASEPLLLRTYPSLYARFGLLISLAASSAIVIVIIRTACADEDSLLCVPNLLRWLGLIPFAFFLSVLHHRFNNAYILDDTNISRQEGRLSLQYRVPSIRYSDIKGITVTQSFWGRIFDFGSIALGTAANEGMELMLDDVRAPYELAEIIESLRQMNFNLDSEDHT